MSYLLALIKVLVGLIALAIVSLTAMAAIHVYGESQTAEVYEHVTLGQSEASIVRLLGKPDRMLPCGKSLWWDGEMASPPKNDGRCVKWVRYNYFLSAYGFGYSRDGVSVRSATRYSTRTE